MKAARYFLLTEICLAIIFVLNAGQSLAEESPADVLAARVRDQGHRCDGPVNAERDPSRSKPDEAVWVLKCANATYRIRLDPDMAAHIERLE